MYSALHPLTSGASIGLNLYNDSENLLQCTKKLLQKNALHHQGEHHFSLGLGSSMVLCLGASWGGCGGGFAARVPSLKELMALPCTMQCCGLMKNCGRASRLNICCLCSSMVLCLAASWGGCEGGLAARVPSLKELMALSCTMQCCRLMKNCE